MADTQRTHTTTVRDDLDDLFDYDVNMNDVLREVDTNMDAPAPQKSTNTTGSRDGGVGLGIDEEIKINKPRRQIAKLDESRLLSQAGIPKLRRIAKERLKFKGKGHEYSDLARLLNLYQFWLDDLYPRAKFADGLAIIEKLGHTKRMQVMRREWINEGKPRETYRDSLSLEMPNKDNVRPVHTTAPAAKEVELPKPVDEDNDSDGLYSATPKAKRKQNETVLDRADKNESLFVSEDEDEFRPPDDDLDALLAEDEFNTRTESVAKSPMHSGINHTLHKEDYDDDEEAMEAVDKDKKVREPPLKARTLLQIA